MIDVRPSPIAGKWYEGDPQVLARLVDEYLDEAQLPELDGEVIAVVAPHAMHGGEFRPPLAGPWPRWLNSRRGGVNGLRNDRNINLCLMAGRLR